MSRADARNGASLIVYQTSDSTFQQSWAPAQHASLAALRAAETGRPVVQAALTGESVAFDARGRLLASMGTARHGVVLARLGLPPVTARTPFDHAGDAVPVTAAGIAVIAALSAFTVRRRPYRPVEIMLDGNHRPAPSVSIGELSAGEAPASPGSEPGAPPSREPGGGPVPPRA
jgi:apolipoprotein N-acyltransferase